VYEIPVDGTDMPKNVDVVKGTFVTCALFGFLSEYQPKTNGMNELTLSLLTPGHVVKFL
jgi:hypothetical protein